MYPPRETQIDASDSERRQMDQTDGSLCFRPLALPALTAAIRSPAAVRKKPVVTSEPRRGILDLVHEDAPIL